MQWHARSNRPAVITSVPESPGEELERRRRRYALSAAIFIGSFTAAGLLHRETVLALLLCGVSIVNAHSGGHRRQCPHAATAAG